MSIPSLLPPLSESPDLHDLYTIDFKESEMWYKVGQELGLNVHTLDAIKVEHSKPQSCKRAMFREWLRVSPVTSCTWSHLIQALTKVDQKTAQDICQTVVGASTQSPKSGQPHTAQYPLILEDESVRVRKDTTKLSVSMTPPTPLSLATERKKQFLTETVKVKDSPTSFKAIELLSTGPKKLRQHGTIDSPSIYSAGDRDKGSIRKEICSESNHHDSDQADEIRSVSADVYQTASEDESILVFNYQHDGEAAQQNITLSRVGDQVHSSALT